MRSLGALLLTLFISQSAFAQSIPTSTEEAPATTDTAPATTEAAPTTTGTAPTTTGTAPSATGTAQQLPPLQQPPVPGKNKAPEHASTGWASLAKDTASDYATFPRRPSTWVILGIGVAGTLAAQPADDYVEEHLVGNTGFEDFFSLGKWVGSVYVQMGSAVGLWAVGRYIVAPAGGEPRTNKYSEIGFDLMRAQFLSQGIVQAMKNIGQRDRPTGECCSFPSGHAASAFAAASVLERHLGYRASWPFLVGATYVGTSRLVDNRHFLSDVVMGAAIGTASGWTVVGSRGRNRITMQPVPIKGGMMIALMRVPEPASLHKSTVHHRGFPGQ